MKVEKKSNNNNNNNMFQTRLIVKLHFKVKACIFYIQIHIISCRKICYSIN